MMKNTVTIALQEYEEIQKKVSILIEENRKLNESFTSNSKYVIVSDLDELASWVAKYHLGEKVVLKGIHTDMQFIKYIEERVRPSMERFEELRKDIQNFSKLPWYKKLYFKL